MMWTSTRDLRKRLSSWVATKIHGKRYADMDDTQIGALQGLLGERGAWVLVSCWCEMCDTTANHGWRTRMSICPDCGDKRCERATFHGNACSKPPNVY